MAEKLIVIGNGMAGCRAVEELLARAPGKYDVEIFGAEPQVNYNRIMLSPVLAGEKRFDEIIINGRDLETVSAATQASIKAAESVSGLKKITAGNYGGRLGKSWVWLVPRPHFLNAPATAENPAKNS